ncbi:MAG: hypothetical protein ACKV2V_22615 [Blastocatellia bacterium]
MCKFALLICCLLAVAVPAQDGTAKAKAEAILAEARAMIGSEAARASLRSLAVAGTLRHMDGEHKTESPLKYDVLFPDKFRQQDTQDRFHTIFTVDGDTVQLRQSPVSSIDPGHRAEMQLRESRDPWIRTRVLALQRDDFTRLTLCWTLTAPATTPLEYHHLGVAKGQNRTADIIEARGQNGFITRLVIDQQTHQLVALVWRGKRLADVLRIMEEGGAEPARPAGQVAATSAPANARQTKDEKRRGDFEAAEAKAPEVRFRWILSEHKNVEGLSLPHRIVRAEDGVMKEEWEIGSLLVNPKLDPAIFDARKK